VSTLGGSQQIAVWASWPHAHHPYLALERQVVRLLDRQPVEVGAQSHHPTRKASAKDAHHTGLRDRVAHLEAEVPQPLRNEVSGALLPVAELGVRVQVAAHGDHGGRQALGGGADLGVGGGGRGGGECGERGHEDHRWPPVRVGRLS
jgi:hypothetical protein